MTDVDCDRMGLLLDRFVEGTLGGFETRRCWNHILSCERCSGLVKLMRAEIEPVQGLPKEFTRSVLERTSGLACSRVRGLLEGDSGVCLSHSILQNLADHLQHCNDCSALAHTPHVRNQQSARNALRGKVAGFTGDGLCWGLHGTVSSARQASGLNGRWPVLPAWWRRLSRQPRFGWEAAYVGTLGMILAFGGPIAGASEQVPLFSFRHEVRMTLDSTSNRLGGEALTLGSRAQKVAERAFVQLDGERKNLERTLVLAGNRVFLFATRTRQEFSSLWIRLRGLLSVCLHPEVDNSERTAGSA